MSSSEATSATRSRARRWPLMIKRGNVYWFRRAVPDALVPIVGKHEIKHSLKTSDFAEAKRRDAAALEESEKVFSRARAQLAGNPAIKPEDAAQLASRWYRAETFRMDKSGVFTTWLAYDHESEEDPVTGETHVFYTTLQKATEDAGDAWDAEGNAAEAVVSMLRENGLPIPGKGTSEWSWLVSQFDERVRQLSTWALAREEGGRRLPGDGALPHAPLSTETTAAIDSTRTLAPAGRSLTKLFAAYKEKRVAGGDSRATKASLREYESSVQAFVDLFGDLEVSTITRDKVAEYRIALSKLPAKGSGMLGLTAVQRIERADREDLPRISAGTVRNRLQHLSALLSYGVNRGWLEENPVTASGVGKEVAHAARKHQASNRRRKFYTRDELAKIFSSPVFVDPKWSPPRASFGKAWYWLPVLMYYTGARIEELAQLSASEVKTSEEGIPYLSLLESSDDEDGKRTVKTESSRRAVPLHDDIIARGFLDYVRSLPKGGALFPGLAASPDGYYSTNFAKRWGDYLRKTVGLASPARPSHGFRHTFKTLAREAGITEDVHDAITGHAGGGVGRRYGATTLKTMAGQLTRFPTIRELLARGETQPSP